MLLPEGVEELVTHRPTQYLRPAFMQQNRDRENSYGDQRVGRGQWAEPQFKMNNTGIGKHCILLSHSGGVWTTKLVLGFFKLTYSSDLTEVAATYSGRSRMPGVEYTVRPRERYRLAFQGANQWQDTSDTGRNEQKELKRKPDLREISTGDVTHDQKRRKHSKI